MVQVGFIGFVEVQDVSLYVGFVYLPVLVNLVLGIRSLRFRVQVDLRGF